MIPQLPSFFDMLLMQPSKQFVGNKPHALKTATIISTILTGHHYARIPRPYVRPVPPTFLNSSVFLSEGRAGDVKGTSDKMTFISKPSPFPVPSTGNYVSRIPQFFFSHIILPSLITPVLSTSPLPPLCKLQGFDFRFETIRPLAKPIYVHFRGVRKTSDRLIISLRPSSV
jgi:hypothetical protein